MSFYVVLIRIMVSYCNDFVPRTSCRVWCECVNALLPCGHLHSESAAIEQNDELAITKTSGELGASHHCNGAWDRLEGQDSSEDKRKCRGSRIAVYLAAQTATTAVMRHLCSAFLFLPPNDPKRLCVPDSNPSSH